MLQFSQLQGYQDKYTKPAQLTQHKRFDSQPIHLTSPVKSFQQDQQVQELTRIREKLEYYNEGNRKKPFEQVIEEMDFKYKKQPLHIDPTQTTLNEIDRLHNDYLNSGMRDPIYLNTIQKLRHDFLKQAQPIGYYIRPPIQQGNPQSYSNNPSYSNHPSYTNHPIYDHLPISFKRELNQQHSLPVLQHNRQKTDFSGSINDQMLSYMRNEENEAVRQLSMDRLSNIQMIKTSIENEVVKERINKMAQEMTMKRKRGLEQDEDTTAPYSHLEGFTIQWDLISKLPIQYTKARISFGIFKQTEEYHAYKLTSDCFTQAETYRTNKCIFNQIEQMRDIQADDKTILYIEIWVFESDGSLSMLGWSVYKLFDRTASLYIGKYKLPFYQQQYKPRDLLVYNKEYPYYGNLSLYFRIMQQPQHLDEIIFVESDYHIPHYHIHRECKIIREEVKDKTQFHKDLAKAFAYDRPLREREPQLFGDLPLSPTKKQRTLKPTYQITDDEYFGDEKQKESPTTSIQQKYQVKSRFSKKIESVEHLPTQEKNSQQSSDAIIKLESIKHFDKDSQKGSTRNIRIQLIQEEQFSSKRSIDVKEATRRANGENTIRGDRTIRGDKTSRHLLLLQQQQDGSSNQISNVKQFNKFKRKQKAQGDQTVRSLKNIEIPLEPDLGSTRNKVVISGAGIVVMDILKLNNLDTKKYNELKLKIGFFINDIILKDENETDCVMTQNLIPNEVTDKSQRYNLHAEFSLDYSNILSIFEQEGFTTKDAYVYIAIYQNNALLGWFVAPLFKETNDINNLQIDSGLFQVNLIKPPGQQAPFHQNDMIKSNIQLDFVLMSKKEQLKSIPTISKYTIQEEEKVKNVGNPEWNTQIMIQLLNTYNFVSKEDLQISISIQSEQKIIEDVLLRQCQVKDDLDVFSTDSKNIYISNYYTIFRVGKKYLQDTFSKFNLLNYVLIIHQHNQFLGMVQLNVFKKTIIQTGEFRLNLYTINNKKLSFEIKLLIKEVPLQLDIYERTPSYRMSKSKGGYTQQEEEDEVKEKDSKKTSSISRYLPITIQIQEVQLKNRKVVLKILKNNEIVKQQNEDDCIQEMIVPNSAVFIIDIDDMIKSKEGYFVLIEVYDDVLIAWYAMNMVFNKKLYTTKLFTELYKSPRLQTPLDYKLVKKFKEKIEFQIHQGDVRIDIRKLNQKQRTGLDIHIHSISNLPNNGDNQIMIQLINDGKVIQDKLLKLCQTKQNMNIVNGYIKDLSFNFNLNKGDVPKNTQLGIYISQESVEVRWCVISLYTLGKLKEGKVEKKMFTGPFNKTNKVSNTDVCLEIE